MPKHMHMHPPTPIHPPHRTGALGQQPQAGHAELAALQGRLGSAAGQRRELALLQLVGGAPPQRRPHRLPARGREVPRVEASHAQLWQPKRLHLLQAGTANCTLRHTRGAHALPRTDTSTHQHIAPAHRCSTHPPVVKDLLAVRLALGAEEVAAQQRHHQHCGSRSSSTGHGRAPLRVNTLCWYPSQSRIPGPLEGREARAPANSQPIQSASMRCCAACWLGHSFGRRRCCCCCWLCDAVAAARGCSQGMPVTAMPCIAWCTLYCSYRRSCTK